MTSTPIARKRATPAKPVKNAAAKAKATAPAVKTPAAKPEGKPAGKAQHVEPIKAKHKLVRDSFTIPKSEYAVLDSLKTRAANLKRPTKKSELLRAGILALNGMTDKVFLSVLSGVPSLKTGRPKSPDVATPATKKNSAE